MMGVAAIFGCAGEELREQEAEFFTQAQPVGFILFARNIGDAAGVSRLISALRATCAPRRVLVLVDQEGGRVQRLRPPHWPALPTAAALGALAAHDLARAQAAALATGRAMAKMLVPLGFDSGCAPVLDCRQSDTDAALADRCLSDDPRRVVQLAGALIEGMRRGGLLPLIKHLPGLGRATCDSHAQLPSVACDLEALMAHDGLAFQALAAQAPLGMTAHILYPKIDKEFPATLSARVIAHVIRARIGFHGLLLSDDLNMGALSGELHRRAQQALAAGCDVALHCSGKLDEMRAVANASSPLTPKAAKRLEAAMRWRQRPILEVQNPIDEMMAELSTVLKGAAP